MLFKGENSDFNNILIIDMLHIKIDSEPHIFVSQRCFIKYYIFYELDFFINSFTIYSKK